MFTTAGFFKSALEECADIYMKEAWQFVQTSEKERINLTPKESNEQKRLRQVEYDRCDVVFKKKEGQKGSFGHEYCTRSAKLSYDINYKWKIIRNISPEENQKAYKKFISKSLKKKMKDRSYSDYYANCIKYKKWNPELFKAKYD
tara:strand:- start:46 stop:480 length:435 start_codon:yes stop_codon:yes gene_type:complete